MISGQLNPHRSRDCLTKSKMLPPPPAAFRTRPILASARMDQGGTGLSLTFSAARKLPARSFPGYTFPGCLRLDRQRVHGPLKFRLKRGIDHAMAFDPALPFEGPRHNIDPEMRLAARPVAGMALMQMGFVRDVEAFGHESFTQLVYDIVLGAHGCGITSVAVFRQWRDQKRGIRNVKT